jgi:3'(2'), 5'-bisphosphate nucleotidase
MSELPSTFATALAEIAQDAAKLVLQFSWKTTHARRKSDGSPVTAADEAAEALILSRLKVLAPDVPVIAEERMARRAGEAPGRLFFLVDPLDGTEDFIKGGEEFTVNIGLIHAGEAVCGALTAPAKHRAFLGEKGKGAWEISEAGGAVRPIHARRCPADGLTVLVSRNHGASEAQLYAGQAVAHVEPMSSSLKFAILAAGEADLYPRLGPTMEWDTAAGQAILEAAGGQVLSASGGVFGYGKAGFRNGGFIARGVS